MARRDSALRRLESAIGGIFSSSQSPSYPAAAPSYAPVASGMSGTETHPGKQADEGSTPYDRLSEADKQRLLLTVAGEIDPRYAAYGTPENTQEIANIVQTITTRMANTGQPMSKVLVGSQYNALMPKYVDTSTQQLQNNYPAVEAAVRAAVNGDVMPTNEGMTNYHATWMNKPPTWGNLTPVADVGGHTFYTPKYAAQSQLPPVPVSPITAGANLPPPTGIAPPTATVASTVGNVFGAPGSLGPPPSQPSALDLKRAQIGQMVSGMIAAHPEQAGALTAQMAAAGLNVDGTPLSGPTPAAPEPNADYRAAANQVFWNGGFQPTTNPTMPPQSTFPARPAGPPAGMPAAPPPPPIAATGNTIPSPPPGLAAAQSMPAPNFNGYQPPVPMQLAGQGISSAPPQPSAGIVLAPGLVPQVGALGADATGVAGQNPTLAADAGQIPLTPDGRINAATAVAGNVPPVAADLTRALQIAAQAAIGPGTATAGPPISAVGEMGGNLPIPQPLTGQATANLPLPSPTALGSPQISPPLDLTGSAVPGVPSLLSPSANVPDILQSAFPLDASAMASPDQRMAAAFGNLPTTPAQIASPIAQAGQLSPQPSAMASPLPAAPPVLTGQAVPNLGPPPSASAAAGGLPLAPAPINGQAMALPGLMTSATAAPISLTQLGLPLSMPAPNFGGYQPSPVAVASLPHPLSQPQLPAMPAPAPVVATPAPAPALAPTPSYQNGGNRLLNGTGGASGGVSPVPLSDVTPAVIAGLQSAANAFGNGTVSNAISGITVPATQAISQAGRDIYSGAQKLGSYLMPGMSAAYGIGTTPSPAAMLATPQSMPAPSFGGYQPTPSPLQQPALAPPASMPLSPFTPSAGLPASPFERMSPDISSVQQMPLPPAPTGIQPVSVPSMAIPGTPMSGPALPSYTGDYSSGLMAGEAKPVPTYSLGTTPFGPPKPLSPPPAPPPPNVSGVPSITPPFTPSPSPASYSPPNPINLAGAPTQQTTPQKILHAVMSISPTTQAGRVLRSALQAGPLGGVFNGSFIGAGLGAGAYPGGGSWTGGGGYGMGGYGPGSGGYGYGGGGWNDPYGGYGGSNIGEGTGGAYNNR